MERTKTILPVAERLAGVEWMRGGAAFAVIGIHAGLVVHGHTTAAAAELPDIFGFAVPFFLMMAFFFAVRAEKTEVLSWSGWIKARAGRLLVPFVFWSGLYLALHIGKLLLHHQARAIKTLLGDPAALILNGGDSIALYFLPLLFTGLVLIRFFSGLLKRGSVWVLLIGVVAGMALHSLFHSYGATLNGLFPGLLESPLRLALGLIRDAARCAPLVFIAALMVRAIPAANARNAYAMLGAGAIYLIVPHFLPPPGYASDSVIGLGAFLVAWGLSGLVSSSKLATVVGLYSFGVYLVHQVFLELLQMFWPVGGTMGVVGILGITGLVYAVSMGTVGVASWGGVWVRRVFGLR